jgi:hypothetical protein
MAIELYNLKSDPAEQADISAFYPEIVKQMEAIMIEEHTTPTIDRFKMTQLGDVLTQGN